MAVSNAQLGCRLNFIFALFRRIEWLLAGFALSASATALAAQLDKEADRVLGQPNFTSVTANQGGGATASTLNEAFGICVDLHSGRLYVADTFNNRILSWPDTATFTNGQAADMVIGQPDFVSKLANQGAANPTASTLYNPAGIKVDNFGNLYVCDTGNNRVLEYDNPATHDTIADRVIGQADFTHGSANRGNPNASFESLNQPSGIAFNSQGTIYIADTFNNRVIAVTSPFDALLSSIPRIYGQPDTGQNISNNGGISAKSLSSPYDVAVDASDNVLIADTGNNRVLIYIKPEANPFITPVADQVRGQVNFTTNQFNRGGAAANNTLGTPYGIGVDPSGRIHIADFGNNRVLGFDSTFSSLPARVYGQADFSGSSPNRGTIPSAETLAGPSAVCFDRNNNLFISDYLNNRVLEYDQPVAANVPEISALFSNTTSAGSPSFELSVRGNGFLGSSVVQVNGSPRPTQFDSFSRLSATISASDVSSIGDLLISVNSPDVGTSALKVFSVHARIPGDTVADAVLGQPDFTSSKANADGFSPRSLNNPTGMAINPTTGRLWVCDQSNDRVLSWPDAAAFADGQPADFVLGQPDLFTLNEPTPASASNLIPLGIAVDANGNVYVADARNRVLEFDDPLTTDTVADRVFGQPNFTTSTQNTGGVSAASMAFPIGVALDAQGRLYVGDSNNNRALIFNSPLASQVADVVLGQPDFTTNTVNNGGISARSLYFPEGVALDSEGRLYVADSSNNRVLQYDSPLSNGVAATRVFGQAAFDSNTVNAGGISASSLNFPTSVSLSATGELYICDRGNSRVLEYNSPLGPSNAADRVFGQGDSFTTATPNNGGANAHTLSGPQAVLFGQHGTLLVTDSFNNRVLAFDKPVNHAPTILSAISTDPSTVTAGSPVKFSVAATDPDSDVLTFHWDFGDGSSSDEATPTHVYATTGTFTVTVTASDPLGASVQASTTLSVGRQFALSKLQIKLNFAKTGSDSIALSGTLPVPQGFSAAGQPVTVDVGGATVSFTLSSKGAAKNGHSSFKLQLKSKKGTVPAQTAKFSASLKGSFAANLADEGLTGAATVKKQPVTVRVALQFNGETFIKLQQLSYSAVAGKSGSAK